MRQNEALWKNVLLQELCSLLGFRLVACFLRCAFTLFSRAMDLWIAFEAAPVQACGTLHSRPSMSGAAAFQAQGAPWRYSVMFSELPGPSNSSQSMSKTNRKMWKFISQKTHFSKYAGCVLLTMT